jgi:hypothetical protein
MRTRLGAIVFGATNIVSAIMVALGVFVALPARFLPVDLSAALVTLLLAISGMGLLFRQNARSTQIVARISQSIVLAFGLLLVALLAISASYLVGIYGPVGRGGALIFLLVVALVIPYLCVFPAAQLVWLAKRSKARSDDRA